MARRKRGQPSRIEQLAGEHPEIKATVDEGLRGGASQQEILRRTDGPLRAVGEPPLSRSGLSRYATEVEEIGAELREIRAIADVWTAKVGERPTSEAGKLTIEILSTMAFKASMRAYRDAAADPDATIDTALIGELALAQYRLERGAQIGARREQELLDAFEKRTAEASKAVEQVMREAGASEDLEAAVRAAIEGAAR